MNSDQDLSSPSQLASHGLPSQTTILPGNNLDAMVSEIQAIADRSQGDILALLHLLRTLEQLHREIQEGYFQGSLPDSRQALYTLLRDIEENGGWPYIPRWKLQALFANLPETES